MNRRHFSSLLCSVPLLGQSKKPAPEPPKDQAEQVIRLDVTRVNVLFSVTDRRGRFVNDLSRDDFELFENKRKQEIVEFVATTDLPLRIAVLVDVSNSIRDRFRFELEAASEFLTNLVRKRRDKALIVGFDTESNLAADLTDDTEELSRKLRGLRPGGGTALYDAIAFVCRDKLSVDKPAYEFNRAVILIGDGDDNSSKFSRDQAIEFAHKVDAKIYCISTNSTRVETDGDRVLKLFSRDTGAQAFFPFKAQDLSQDFENIAHELRSQYSITFRPDPVVLDGQFHPIDIRLKSRRDLKVRARQGYYASRA
jgi:Ca-activated chloride channel homolog